MRNGKFSVPIIIILVIAIISLGIAFATFSTTLNINGHAEVGVSSWEIVFEGYTNPNVMDAPETNGTASQITLPTIKRNATEISTYSVSLRSPGDSITYNFKIHNKGNYDATVSSLIIAGVSNPSTGVSGSALVTDSSIATANANTLSQIEYKFYYSDNTLVGQNPTRDCLAAGETEEVSLRIVFAPGTVTDTSILPSSDLVLDNLGVTLVYTQGQTCPSNNNSGGGGSGGNQPSPTTTGGGTSNTPPTVTPTKITGGNVSVPTSGDSVTYSLEYVVDECTVINSISIPTTADLAAANPGIDSSALSAISIVVTDEDGNTINGKQIAANSSEIIKVIISNSGGTLNSSLNIPDLDIAYVEDCSASTAGTQYLLSVDLENLNPIFHSYTGYTYTWTPNKSDLITAHPEANTMYVKKVNESPVVCITLNSVEHCFDSSTTESSLISLCGTIGGASTNYMGSWEDEGVTCYNAEYMQTWDNLEFQISVSDNPFFADKYIYVEKYVNNAFYAYCWISFPFNGRESSGCSYNNAGTGWYY